MDDTTRRRFLQTAGATGVVLAAGPGFAGAQAGGEERSGGAKTCSAQSGP